MKKFLQLLCFGAVMSAMVFTSCKKDEVKPAAIIETPAYK